MNLWKIIFLNLFSLYINSTNNLLETDIYTVEKKIERQNPLFTQGLFTDEEGYVIESGGGYGGQSKLIKYKLDSPNDRLVTISFSDIDFLEGSTMVNRTIFVLTWTQRKIYIYTDLSNQTSHKFVSAKQETTFLPKEISEGWGLTYDGKYLIISDGSNKIFFVDFSDLNEFKVVKSITVQDKLGKEYKNLNELEYVDNIIFANVWHQNIILMIDPQTGDVLKVLDFKDLVDYEKNLDSNNFNFESVLNGIAYDTKSKKFIITGKLWKHLYIVKFK